MKQYTIELSFPCLRAEALRCASLKTGIQDAEEDNWIPAGVYPVLDTGQE
jgi:hypothetical protein